MLLEMHFKEIGNIVFYKVGSCLQLGKANLA